MKLNLFKYNNHIVYVTKVIDLVNGIVNVRAVKYHDNSSNREFTNVNLSHLTK